MTVADTDKDVFIDDIIQLKKKQISKKKIKKKNSKEHIDKLEEIISKYENK